MGRPETASPRLLAPRVVCRRALSRNHQPNAAFARSPITPAPPANTHGHAPHAVGPVLWPSSIVCRCKQGSGERSVSKILRADRGYYWRRSAAPGRPSAPASRATCWSSSRPLLRLLTSWPTIPPNRLHSNCWPQLRPQAADGPVPFLTQRRIREGERKREEKE